MVSWLLSLNYDVQEDNQGKVVRLKQMPSLVFGLGKLSEISECCSIEEEPIRLIKTGDDSYDCQMDATYLLFESTCFKCRANQR
jgi:hypothetical protein